MEEENFVFSTTQPCTVQNDLDDNCSFLFLSPAFLVRLADLALQRLWHIEIVVALELWAKSRIMSLPVANNSSFTSLIHWLFKISGLWYFVLTCIGKEHEVCLLRIMLLLCLFRHDVCVAEVSQVTGTPPGVLIELARVDHIVFVWEHLVVYVLFFRIFHVFQRVRRISLLQFGGH